MVVAFVSLLGICGGSWGSKMYDICYLYLSRQGQAEILLLTAWADCIGICVWVCVYCVWMMLGYVCQIGYMFVSG